MSWLFSALVGLPEEFVTVLIAALPIAEQRVSIPVAVTAFHFSAAAAFFYSFLGNIIPIFLVYALLPLILAWAAGHWPWLRRAMDKYLAHLEGRHRAKIERYGAAAAGLIAAIPFPGAGTWTAAALAVLFNIRPSYGIPAMAVGSAVSCLIVLLATEGLLGAFRFFL